MNESRIAEIRRSKGWTQERLAAQSSVTVRTIQRLEAGQDASMDTLSRIAAALQVPVGELFASVQTPQFQASVDGLEQRMAQQQEQRDSYTKGVVLIYRGVGIVLVFRHGDPCLLDELGLVQLAGDPGVLGCRAAGAGSGLPAGTGSEARRAVPAIQGRPRHPWLTRSEPREVKRSRLACGGQVLMA